MSKITDAVENIAKPVIETEGCSLWNIEYTREAGSNYLRIFIDKEGGVGVGIDDCERISRLLDPLLDEEDPIPDSYIFEVSSPGIERELKRPSDFNSFLGSSVEVHTYRPVGGKKTVVGILKEYNNGDVTIKVGKNDVLLEKADIALVKLHVSF